MLIGCGKKTTQDEVTSQPEKKQPTQTTPPPAGQKQAAIKNSFWAVDHHLDQGGSFYLYLSTEPIGFQSAGQVALIGDRYKIYGSGSRNKEKGQALPTLKLFDLIMDPSEQNDLAAQHPDLIKKMSATLEHWRKSCRHSDDGGDCREQ